MVVVDGVVLGELLSAGERLQLLGQLLELFLVRRGRLQLQHLQDGVVRGRVVAGEQRIAVDGALDGGVGRVDRRIPRPQADGLVGVARRLLLVGGRLLLERLSGRW